MSTEAGRAETIQTYFEFLRRVTPIKERHTSLWFVPRSIAASCQAHVEIRTEFDTMDRENQGLAFPDAPLLDALLERAKHFFVKDKVTKPLLVFVQSPAIYLSRAAVRQCGKSMKAQEVWLNASLSMPDVGAPVILQFLVESKHFELPRGQNRQTRGKTNMTGVRPRRMTRVQAYKWRHRVLVWVPQSGVCLGWVGWCNSKPFDIEVFTIISSLLLKWSKNKRLLRTLEIFLIV